MRSYPYIQDLFKNVLAKSKAIQGRFFLCPKFGTEINSDELEQVINDLVIPTSFDKKYPLALLMPPTSFGKYTLKRAEWETYRLVMFFLNTSYYQSGTNQTVNPNPNTKTSTHTIQEDFHDMKRCAANFINVLDRVIKNESLFNTAIRIDNERVKVFTPIPDVGVNRVSGQRLEFDVSLLIGCELEDYDEADILSIQVPEKDSHPEHQL